MKTTEIFIDQVLIGFLVVAALALPFLPELIATFGQKNSTSLDLLTGSLVVAVAYLLGMVVDRLADTFVDDLDRHHRARFALNLLLKRLTKDGSQELPFHWDDPFPEGYLRLAVLKAGGAIAEQLQYLRTRIRLARSLAVLLPTVTAALVLGAGRAVDERSGLGWHADWLEALLAERSIWWPITFIGAYPVALIIDTVIARCSGHDSVVKAPRTDSKDMLRYAQQRGFVPDAKNPKNKKRQRESLVCDILGSRLFWLDVLLFVTTGALVVHHPGKTVCVIFLFGFGVAVASALTWWRISETFMDFLKTYGGATLRRGQAAARPAEGTPSQ